MKIHPYKSLPDKAFWRRSVASLEVGEVAPIGRFDLKIMQDTKVATAGSCFAQHIARHLKKSGFQYFVAEDGHPILPDEIRREHQYGTFSCRYGNIYTTRQLLQLFKRAYGTYTPAEAAWIEADGSVLDPFRPTVQPGGFVSVEEMESDRSQHLASVRKMFQESDVFVFTLGLTECWRSISDGAVFPVCPGAGIGIFDDNKYEFYNQDVFEIIADLEEFRASLREVNSNVQIVLTVSPVPLMATAEPDAHVLSATTYSKSALRVAAESMHRKYDDTHYFPSYEIITGAYNRGRYYSNDLRNVTEEGVSHVMRLFLQCTTNQQLGNLLPREADPTSEPFDEFVELAQHIVEVECDELLLDPQR